MPHQQYIADVSHEIDPETGLLAYDTVIVIVNRQMGKSELTLPVMTHRCIGQLASEPQRVLYAAQTADEARKKWHDHHLGTLQASPLRRLFTARERLNFEAILWHNGSAWSPIATTGKTGGTGDWTDLGVLDEGWVHDDTRAEQSIAPTQLTRAQPQLWVVSMVPGPTRAKTTKSTYLRNKITQGKAAVEAGVRSGIAFFYWCAAPGAEPGDEATWLAHMPAVCPAWPCRCDPAGGWRHTVPLAAIRRDWRRLDLDDFTAEYLGLFPDESSQGWQVMTQTEWENAKRPQQHIEGRPAFGVWVSPQRDWAAIAAAGLREGGGRLVELTGREPVVDYRPGAGWVVPRLAELERHDPVAVVTNDRVVRDAAARDGLEVQLVAVPDRAAACGLLVEGVAGQGGDVRHIGQAEMTGAVAQAVWRRVGSSGSVLEAPSSAADICPAPAAAVALWAWSTPRVHRSEAAQPLFAFA